MTTRHQVQCVNKTDRQSAHERIRRIGGRNSDSTAWRLTEDEAIQGIEQGKWQFFVHVGNHTVDVIVASREGRKYLKTTADGERPDNLLSLPECV